jgi:hypothetical protein
MTEFQKHELEQSSIYCGPSNGTGLSVPIPGTSSVLGTKLVFQGAIATSAATIPLTNGFEIIVGK